MMHGCCAGSKTGWENATADGGGEKWHYNNAWFASRGYAVLTYTSRGFVNGSNQGSNGYAELDSRRYEINDYQRSRARSPAPPTSTRAPGATRRSTRRRSCRPAAPTAAGSRGWRSPTRPGLRAGGPDTNMRVAAAATKYGWTDLAQSLVPNGNERKTRLPGTDPHVLHHEPAGYPKRTINAGLYAAGKTGVPPGSAHTTFPPKIDQAQACLTSGDPFTAEPALHGPGSIAPPDADREFITDRSAYYQQNFWTGLANASIAPVPVFSAGTFTDPLFPPQEHRRMAERLKATVARLPDPGVLRRLPALRAEQGEGVGRHLRLEPPRLHLRRLPGRRPERDAGEPRPRGGRDHAPQPLPRRLRRAGGEPGAAGLRPST